MISSLMARSTDHVALNRTLTLSFTTNRLFTKVKVRGKGGSVELSTGMAGGKHLSVF